MVSRKYIDSDENYQIHSIKSSITMWCCDNRFYGQELKEANPIAIIFFLKKEPKIKVYEFMPEKNHIVYLSIFNSLSYFISFLYFF